MSKNLYFVTNRNLIEKNGKAIDFGKQFNSVSPVNLRLGKITIDGKIDLYQDIPTTTTISYDTDEYQKQGTKRLFDELFNEMKDADLVHKDTLIFIHGFNVSFKSAISIAFKLQDKFISDDTNNIGRIVLFTWPSDGETHKYYSDCGDAYNSGLAFARGFLKMRDFFNDVVNKLEHEKQCGGKIHLMAHSMGNYVLQSAFQSLRNMNFLNQNITHLFNQILMFAADVDSDCFEKETKLKELSKICERITVYINSEDVALKVSDKVKGNSPRLGTFGPNLPFQIPNRVTIVDASLIVTGFFEHSYYFLSKVFKDLAQTLKGIPVHSIKGRNYQPSNNTFLISK